MNQTNRPGRGLAPVTMTLVLSLGVGALTVGASGHTMPTIAPPIFTAGSAEVQKSIEAPLPAERSESVASRQTAIREASDDPDGFLAALVKRYHGLDRYEDTARVVRITERSGAEPTRTETDIRCSIDEEGAISVQTAGDAARKAVGISIPFRGNPVIQEAYEQYALWLAPHMALRDQDGPLAELSQQSDEPLRATRASAVMLDERDMVQLDLTSGDAESHSATSRFSLFVDPVSMLVQRVETQHRLPDGAVHSTTVDITPRVATEAPAPLDVEDDAPDEPMSDPCGEASPVFEAEDDSETNEGPEAGATLGVFDMFDAGVFGGGSDDAADEQDAATEDVDAATDDAVIEDDQHREYTDGGHQHRVIF